MTLTQDPDVPWYFTEEKMQAPDRIAAHIATICATADIAAALRELQYIRDPRLTSILANVRGRLDAARTQINTAALFIEDAALTVPSKVVVHKIMPTAPASQTEVVA